MTEMKNGSAGIRVISSSNYNERRKWRRTTGWYWAPYDGAGFFFSWSWRQLYMIRRPADTQNTSTTYIVSCLASFIRSQQTSVPPISCALFFSDVFYILANDKKNGPTVQYSIFFYWTFSRFITFPCVRRWPPNSAAPAYPMKMFSFFFSYRYRSFASILDSLHMHIWNEIVADDGGDRIVMHVMCFVCFICVTQIWNI